MFTTSNQVKINCYDYSEVKQYVKVLPHIFWTSREVIAEETLKRTIHIDIKTDEEIKLILNGKEINLNLN